MRPLNKVWEDCYDSYPATMHSPFSKTVSTTMIKIMFDFLLLPIVTVEAAGFHSNLVPHVILHTINALIVISQLQTEMMNVAGEDEADS